MAFDSSQTSNACNLLVGNPTAAYNSCRAASADLEASSSAEPPFTEASIGASAPLLTKPSWLVKVRGALTPREWITVGCLAAAICALHVIGWGTLVVFVVPGHYTLPGGGGTLGVGLGVTAYMLGMRHAFDADHIAAIDNTTRKFLAEGRRTLTVGFWFALGHSSVVFLAALIIAVGFKAFPGEVESEESQLHVILGLVGALVSSIFLLLIGAINLLVLIHLVKVFRAMRKGTAKDTDLSDLALQGGMFGRYLGWVARRRPFYLAHHHPFTSSPPILTPYHHSPPLPAALHAGVPCNVQGHSERHRPSGPSPAGGAVRPLPGAGSSADKAPAPDVPAGVPASSPLHFPLHPSPPLSTALHASKFSVQHAREQRETQT
ncbi:unnamed protein product [Closterium sp. Naga37s-1]|nr:unnamed protein product [Closterium sp. Naga37s-1]